MACATLKRTHEYENANTHPTKKRRCNFLDSFERDATTITANRLTTGDENACGENVNERSAFKNVNILSLSPSKIRDDIQLQAQYLRKGKYCNNTLIGGCERMQDGSESSGSESPQRDPQQHNRNQRQHHHQQQQIEDKAVFTFKQVQQICERMLKEKDVEIRAEYDGMLATKLAEQYDQFVKFTFDQIQNNYKGTPSYLT